MAERADHLLHAGCAALEEGDVGRARSSFEASIALEETAEALERLAQCLSLDVDYRGAVDLFERAYTKYRDRGDVLAAVRIARSIAYLSAVFGDWAIMSGWLSRVQSLIADIPGAASERAWVDVFLCFAQPDIHKNEPILRDAIAIGRRHGDASLEFDALSVLGQLLVHSGRIDEGLALQDEALAAACAGEVKDVIVVEGIFCGMFTSCELAHDVDRAEQWIRAADDVVRARGVRSVSAFCRAHLGGILTAAGRWPEAEAELLESVRIFDGARTIARAIPIVRLADLRVRQGRLEEAERLLGGLDQHPDARRPLAALHLARGETALARDCIERALAEHEPDDPLTAGPLLALLVDVNLAAGDVDAAAIAADRLEGIAQAQQGAYLKAAAALARGLVCIARDAGNARERLNAALSGFSRARMPLESARTRLELARAVERQSREVAVAQAKVALEEFERLAAPPYVDRAAALLRSLGAPVRVGPRGHDALTKREAEVLELLGHGLSNPEIADRLVIARKTAGHHVSRILAKLGLRSRSEAAVYAAQMTKGRASR